MDTLGTLQDITGAKVVEVEIRNDGKVVWLNVDGITRTRVCRVDQLVITDNRPQVGSNPK